MKRRSFLKGIAAALVTKALPAPAVAGRLTGDVTPPTGFTRLARPIVQPVRQSITAGKQAAAAGAGAIFYIVDGLMTRNVQ